MYNLVSVAVLDRAYYLLEELASLVLLESAMIYDVIEEFSACKLQNHDDLFWCCYDRVEFDDMRMSQQLKILNLSFDTSSHVSSDKLASSDYLESHLLSADLMSSQLDFTKGTLAECLDDFILTQPSFHRCRKRIWSTRSGASSNWRRL